MPEIQRISCGLLLASVGWLLLAPAMATPPPYEVQQLKHHGLWTFRDPERMRRLNLAATDLGVSFPMTLPSGERQLVFLFGDTHHFGPFNTGRWDEDTIAAAPYEWRDRTTLPPLNWLQQPNGEFLSLIVPGENLRGMEVPLDGVQIGSRVVLFFNAEFSFQTHRHGFLICAEAPEGRFDQLQRRFRQPTDRFLNVSVSPDTEDPETIWIFGSGHYRRSPIFLARAPAATLDDFSTWRFLSGDEWMESESDAAPLIEGWIGELSVRYVPAAESWVMMYHRPARLANGHRIGVYIRFAPHPTGPWSDELAVLEPDAQQGIGYTEFMHAHEEFVGFCDGLANPGRERDWGGPYGPYIVPEWSYAEGGRLHIVHTLSSWNPYQVNLMEVVLSATGDGGRLNDEGADETRLAGPANDVVFPVFAEWAGAADPFVVERREDGEWLILQEAAARGSVQWTVPPGSRVLEFEIEGEVVARLYDQAGQRVRESRGWTGEPRKVRWRIDRFKNTSVVFEVVGRRDPAWRGGRITQPRLAQPD
jgi:hypothetical protein